jgi:hypothetical protein
MPQRQGFKPRTIAPKNNWRTTGGSFMADDRTCLDCIAQYSHLPVKLCEEHADERRAGETRMTLKELAAAAEAAQEKAWEANNAAWAAWQAAQNLADVARALANKAKEKQE